MYPYRIRLRGPWECEPLAWSSASAEPLPPARRMTLPCRWHEGGLHDFAGRVRFRRRFGQPRQIDAHERVWLTFDGVDESAAVWLNGEFLGSHTGAVDPFAFEVTPLLRPRNELVVDVEAPDGNGGVWGEVALEIRCSAYLRGVRAWLANEGGTTLLHATGEVVGSADRPLELYVLLDGSTVIYATVEAIPAGRTFAVASEPLPQPAPDREGGRPRVRVDLVNGASPWYTLEL